MSNTPKPQANGLDDKELIKRIDAIYDESRQMAMLRIGSPICFLRKGMLALITEARIGVTNQWFQYMIDEVGYEKAKQYKDTVDYMIEQLKENK